MKVPRIMVALCDWTCACVASRSKYLTCCIEAWIFREFVCVCVCVCVSESLGTIFGLELFWSLSFVHEWGAH